MQTPTVKPLRLNTEQVVAAIKGRGLERAAYFLLAAHQPLFGVLQNIFESVLPASLSIYGVSEKYGVLFATIREYATSSAMMTELKTRLSNEL